MDVEALREDKHHNLLPLLDPVLLKRKLVQEKFPSILIILREIILRCVFL